MINNNKKRMAKLVKKINDAKKIQCSGKLIMEKSQYKGKEQPAVPDDDRG